MKKKALLFMCLAMILGNLTSAFGAEGVIKDGRTLVPLRGVFEELGFDVGWMPNAEIAYIGDGTKSIVSIHKGDNYITARGEKIYPDVPPQIINGSFYLPLRAIGDAVGADTSWDNENKMAHISCNGKDVYVKCAVTQVSNTAKSKNTGDSIIPGVRSYVYDDIKKLFYEEENKYTLDYIESIAGNETEIEKLGQVSKANQKKMEEYLNDAQNETEKEFVLYAGAMLLNYQVAVLDTAQVYAISEAYGIDITELKETISGLFVFMKMYHNLYFSSTDKSKRESYFMKTTDIYKEIHSGSQEILSYFE